MEDAITKKRMMYDKLFLGIVIFFSSIASIPLLSIIWQLFSKGYKQLSVNFFTMTSPTTFDALVAKQSGEPMMGGIANGILGTLFMTGTAAIVAIPLGIIIGVFLFENKPPRLCNFIRFLVETLQGLPSIVIGVIVYAWVVVPVTNSYAAFAGSVALMIIIVPLVSRSTEETLKMLPRSLLEAGLALGIPYPIVVIRVLIPAAIGGIFTGSLLAVSRSIGETAPLMLTALGSTVINFDLSQPTSAIPLLVWEFYNDPNLADMIWSSSLLLIVMILVINLIAKGVLKKWRIN